MGQQLLEVNLKDQWAGDTLGAFGERNTDEKTPYKLYIFPNLLEEKVVPQLRDDINSSIKLKPKDNDLYKFKQSKDFKTEIPAKKLSPLMHEFIDVMLGQVRQHLEKVTGTKLSDKNFDITASRYDVGDYLLCHNDDIKDNLKRHARTLAFIYYLNSRPWTREDGGALIIYDSDSAGEPVKINNSILPRPNTLVVFNTTPKSWHAVEEVCCKDDFRLSINGWFHTDESSRSDIERSIEPCPYNFLKPISLDERLEKFFKECVNQEYLMEKTCFMIRKRFKRKSEINLTNFLVKEKFQEISKALKEATEDEENLVQVGPYNKRNYKVLKLDKLPPICKDLYDAFYSELFFMLLSRLTGLYLQPPSIKHDQTAASNQAESHEEQGCASGESSSEDDDGIDDDGDEDDDDEEEEDDDSGSDDNEDGKDDSDEDEEKQSGDEPCEGSIDNSDIEDETRVSQNKASIAQVSDIVSEDKDQSADQNEEFDDHKNRNESLKRSAEKPTTSRDKSTEQVKKSPKKRRKTSDPLARFEFRHLEPGSYSLIHDYGYELGEKSALDVILHFNHDFAVNFDDGGYISYIDGAPDEDLHDMDYELLTVEPRSNCLSLVYRCDEGTCRFLKYITKSHKANYQDLNCVFYERPDDLPHSNGRITEL